MQMWILGARGSCPAPGSDYLRVGGNTSCVAIGHDDGPPVLVLDAGTGIRALSGLLDGAPFAGTLVLGHLHWDHVFGLPFFAAGDRPDARVDVLVPDNGGTSAIDTLTRAMSPPFFPITPHDLHGSWSFSTYGDGCFAAEGFEILAREVPHKGGRTMGLRVSDGHHSIAYLSDHAPQDLGAGSTGTGEVHAAALELVHDVDILLHDAQYTAAELPTRGSYGHAAAEYAVQLGREGGVGRVLLFHHDPKRTDDEIEALVHGLDAGGPRVEAAIEGSHDVL